MKKHYELVYIIPVKTDEYDPKPVIDLVNQTIQDFNGEIIRTEDWGKRKLAYQIKGFFHGHYVLNVIDFEPQDVKAFNKKIETIRELLRYQIINVLSTDPAKKMVDREKEREDEEKIRLGEKEVVTEEKKVNADDKAEVKPKKETKKEKVSMEDLDKKIDEILNI